jgi:hypothetical protein
MAWFWMSLDLKSMNCNERLVPKIAVPNAMHPRVPGGHKKQNTTHKRETKHRHQY